MSLYRKIQSWATRMEEARVERERQKKLKAELPKPATNASLANYLSAHEGSVASLLDMAATGMVQRISENLSDVAGVLCEKFDETKDWFERGMNMYHKVIQGYFDALNGAAEQRHKEMVQRQEETNAAIFGLAMQMRALEQNVSGRFLAVQDHIRMEAAVSNEHAAVAFNTSIALFENVTGQVQSLKKRQLERVYEPSVEWFMNKADDLIRLGSALQTLRENNAPPNMVTLEIVKSLRSLTDHKISVAELGEALNEKATEWGVAVAA